jgi:hypothetical protein
VAQLRNVAPEVSDNVGAGWEASIKFENELDLHQMAVNVHKK